MAQPIFYYQSGSLVNNGKPPPFVEQVDLADQVLRDFMSQYSLADALNKVADFGHGENFKFQSGDKTFGGMFFTRMTCGPDLDTHRHLAIHLSHDQFRVSMRPTKDETQAIEEQLGKSDILQKVRDMCGATRFQFVYDRRSKQIDLDFLNDDSRIETTLVLKIIFKNGAAQA